MNHSFNVEIAKQYGIEKAVILENFYFWIKKNQANKKNMHDGKAYTFNTASAFAELFPYIKERQIAKLLREMECEDELLLSGQFNNYDRTKSYTLTDKALEMFGEKVKKQNTKNVHSNITKSDNGTSQKVIIESTKKGDCLNTDINTDKKQTDINEISDKPKTDYKIIVEVYFQNYKKLYEQNRVNSEKPIINWKQAGQMINHLLSEFGKDKILMALDKALLDNWIVEQGYSITTILSANQLNKLLNGKNQTSPKQNKNVKQNMANFFDEN